ncbi:AIR synthase family protein [Staphylothermus hellenicus]|uniref:AIR synthase related protein n=1 Tax=Staphylothermus hellenicus (strain DSM 12710 / JCM 10830 / BK20S6-10-b1 / P8) TaxID=591019 RepID=D7DBB1_STAHD|nr:AIR synthase family protein [Staphylothermus hellenicus]ADI31458.1 AIR synthase related protein [Staphylothermus hellenicus DSM 12710]
MKLNKAYYEGGKPSWEFLSGLLSMFPIRDPDLIVGPSIGEDAAIIRFKDGFLIVHSDPITAATRRIGWLAVHIAANDIAVRGAKPRWLLPVILMPPKHSLEQIESIFRDIGSAAQSLDATVIGGHTEFTPGIPRPIISMTAIGYSMDKVVLTRNARPGDKIFVIGRVGGEGASVIAWDFEDLLLRKGISRDIIATAKEYFTDISIVDKALLIRDYANSMHDPTEGGLLQGLREVAKASNTRIILDADKVVLDPIVKEITSTLELDPLKILSSGALIASVPGENTRQVEDLLKEKGYKYSIAGYISEHVRGGELIVNQNGKTIRIIEDVVDEIYKLWSRDSYI